MRWMLQYRANKCVFTLSLVTLGSLKLSSNEFQADGSATEKATDVTKEPGVVDWRT